MCCDTMLCGAQSEGCRFAFCAPGIAPQRVDTTSQLGKTARRGMLDLDVAQASPLFSDHAPREVHLWQ